MTFRSTFAHTTAALARSGLIAVLAVGLVAGHAFAAKGGGSGGSGSGPTVVMVADTNGDGAPNWAERITFSFSTSNAYPVISLTCSRGGVVVYGDSRPMYQPNVWNDPGIFTLSSAAWTGGSAGCTAVLKGTLKGRIVTLGTTTFAAGA